MSQSVGFISDEQAKKRIESKLGLEKPISAKYWTVIRSLAVFERWRNGNDDFDAVIEATEDVLDLEGLGAYEGGHHRKRGRLSPDSASKRDALLLETLLEALVGQYLPLRKGFSWLNFWWFDNEGMTKQFGISSLPVEGASPNLLGMRAGHSTDLWELFSLEWDPDPNSPIGLQKIRATISPWASSKDIASGLEALQERIGCKKIERRKAGLMIAATELVRARAEGRDVDFPDLIRSLKLDEQVSQIPHTLEDPAKARSYCKTIENEFEFPSWIPHPLRIDSRELFEGLGQ